MILPLQIQDPKLKPIARRREEQSRIDGLQNKINSDFYYKSKANWENKGVETGKTAYVQKRLEELRQQS